MALGKIGSASIFRRGGSAPTGWSRTSLPHCGRLAGSLDGAEIGTGSEADAFAQQSATEGGAIIGVRAPRFYAQRWRPKISSRRDLAKIEAVDRTDWR
jgi:hypothetical protein